MGAAQRPRTLTHHGEGPDAGLHGALVLLLQPRTLEQPHGGLQQLHHDRLVRLQEATCLLLQPGHPPPWAALHPGARLTESGCGQRDRTAHSYHGPVCQLEEGTLLPLSSAQPAQLYMAAL